MTSDLTPDLGGDLGTSSERTDPAAGVEGTGTEASAQGSTSGASPTHPGETVPEVHPVEPGVPTDEIEENPGHSHG